MNDFIRSKAYVSSVVKPMGLRSEIAPGDRVISGIVSWGYMQSNRVESNK